MTTPLPHSLEGFAEHIADAVRENLEEAQMMKDTTNLPQIVEQIKNEYHPDAERLNKAIEIVKSQGLSKLPNGNIQVPSGTDTNHRYQVSLVRKECCCLDFAKRHVVDGNHLCKHILASLIWNALPDVKVVPEELQNIYAVLFPSMKVTA